MPVDEKIVVEPSATTAVADGWDEHGTPIVTPKPEPPKKSEEPAASATPATKAKPEEKTAEPGTAKQEPQTKGKPPKDERIAQLVAERNAERDARAVLEERVRTLESAAKPTPKAEPAKPAETPKRPNPFTWTGTQEEFDKAMDKWEEHRDALAVARTRQEQAQMEVQKAMSEVVSQTTVRHPDAKEKIVAATKEILEKAPPYLAADINGSEVLGELLYTLADETTRNNLLETAKTNPGKALRVLHLMEADIQKALSKPAEVKPEGKAPETKPRAPKPPSEVGGRGAATEDADKAAAREGKFSDFEAEQKRKYFAAS